MLSASQTDPGLADEAVDVDAAARGRGRGHRSCARHAADGRHRREAPAVDLCGADRYPEVAGCDDDVDPRAVDVDRTAGRPGLGIDLEERRPTSRDPEVVAQDRQALGGLVAHDWPGASPRSGQVDAEEGVVAMVDDPRPRPGEDHVGRPVPTATRATTLFLDGETRTTRARWSSATQTGPPPIQMLYGADAPHPDSPRNARAAWVDAVERRARVERPDGTEADGDGDHRPAEPHRGGAPSPREIEAQKTSLLLARDPGGAAPECEGHRRPERSGPGACADGSRLRDPPLAGQQRGSPALRTKCSDAGGSATTSAANFTRPPRKYRRIRTSLATNSQQVQPYDSGVPKADQGKSSSCRSSTRAGSSLGCSSTRSWRRPASRQASSRSSGGSTHSSPLPPVGSQPRRDYRRRRSATTFAASWSVATPGRSPIRPTAARITSCSRTRGGARPLRSPAIVAAFRRVGRNLERPASEYVTSARGLRTALKQALAETQSSVRGAPL